MDRKCKTYTVGMMRYIDMLEHKQKVVAESEAEAIKIVQAGTWKSGYDEYYIVEDD